MVYPQYQYCTYVSLNLPSYPTAPFPTYYPYVCSLCLYLCFCFANRFIFTIFLDSTFWANMKYFFSFGLTPFLHLQHLLLPVLGIFPYSCLLKGYITEDTFYKPATYSRTLSSSYSPSPNLFYFSLQPLCQYVIFRFVCLVPSPTRI